MYVTWTSVATGEQGRVEVGANVGYVPGTKILFHDDMLIHFPTGSLAASETSSFTATAARRLPRSFHRIIGQANPDDVVLQNAQRSPLDQLFVSDAGDLSVLAKRRGHAPTFEVHYQNNAVKRQLEHIEDIEGLRQTVTVAENYDDDTVFLLRGGGLEPLIGSVMTNGRSGFGTYWDHRSGQFRRAATGAARTSPGIQFESDEGTGPQERNHVPLKYKHIGRALRVSHSATTNLLPNSHPAPSPGSLGWAAQSGSPTLTFIHGVYGVLDPDDPNWPDGFTQGVLRLHFDSTEAVQSDLATVSSATKYVASIWARGRGNIVFELYGGAGAATTLRATLTNPTQFGNDTDWKRLEGEVTTGASDTRLAFRIRCVSADGVVYVSAASIVRSDYKQASMYEPSSSSLAVRSQEVYTILDPLPEQSGTLQFFFQNTGDNQSSTFSLVDTLSGGRFAVRLVPH
jgi:hypothetical protein